MTTDLMVYLKTTEHCQLDCSHCFTSGSNGVKGFFDVDKTIQFLKNLHAYNPVYSQGNISFHGGEPMLAPVESMTKVWDACKDLWPTIFWSVQTNLTYPLTDSKINFFKTVCEYSFGTSFDVGIRWPDIVKEQLWRDNVKFLTDDGADITVMVCLSADCLQLEPIDIINDMISLGIKHVNFERLTPNGNLLDNTHLIPDNRDLDAWILKMWEQSVEHKVYEKIDNMFFDSLLTSLAYNTHSGCRCRQCEQKVLTLNANGSIGGCPNAAPTKTFGHITDDVQTMMSSPGRMCNISEEATLRPECMMCDVYNTCNGDCHQLAWQGSVCAAPKSLMRNLNANIDPPLFKKFLDGFMGQE